MTDHLSRAIDELLEPFRRLDPLQILNLLASPVDNLRGTAAGLKAALQSRHGAVIDVQDPAGTKISTVPGMPLPPIGSTVVITVLAGTADDLDRTICEMLPAHLDYEIRWPHLAG